MPSFVLYGECSPPGSFSVMLPAHSPLHLLDASPSHPTLGRMSFPFSWDASAAPWVVHRRYKGRDLTPGNMGNHQGWEQPWALLKWLLCPWSLAIPVRSPTKAPEQLLFPYFWSFGNIDYSGICHTVLAECSFSWASRETVSSLRAGQPPGHLCGSSPGPVHVLQGLITHLLNEWMNEWMSEWMNESAVGATK